MANVVIDTAQSVFHQTPESFDGIRVNVASNVDLCAVIDSLMNIPTLRDVRDALVTRQFIGENDTLGKDMLTDDWQQCSSRSVLSRKSSDLATALDYANYHRFVLAVVSCSNAASSADKRFINLYTLASLAADWIRLFISQHGANLFEHSPSSFVGDSGFALNLFCGNAATSRGHEVDRIEPRSERGRRLVKDSVRRGMEVVATLIARVRRATRNTMMFGFLPALITERHLVGMKAAKQPIKADRIIRKLLTELVNRVRLHVRLAVVVWHGSLPTTKVANCIPTVKG